MIEVVRTLDSGRQALREPARSRRLLQVVALLLLGGYAISVGTYISWEAGKLFARAPVAHQLGFARIAGVVIFIFLLAVQAWACRAELFFGHDLELFLAMPLTPRELFARKARVIVRPVIPAFGMVLLGVEAFTLGARMPMLARYLAPLWVLLFFAVMLVLSFLLALYERVRRPLSKTLFLIAIFGVFSALAGREKLLQFVEPYLREDAFPLFWRVIPGSLIAEGFVATMRGNMTTAIVVAIVAILIAIAAIAATVVSTSTRYSTDAILDTRGSLTRRTPEVSLEPEPDDPVARALRARWSRRTRALLTFIRRVEHPEAIMRRVSRTSAWLVLALIGGYIVRALLSDVGEPVSLIGFALLLVAVLPMVTEELMHQPQALLAVRIAADAKSTRGNHDHPLIEILPISAGEFARLMIITDVVIVTICALMLCIALLFTPLSFTQCLLFGGMMYALLVALAIWSPALHATRYWRNPKRTFLATFLDQLKDVGRVTAGGLFIGGAFIVGITMAAQTNERAFIAYVPLAALAILITLGYLRMFRRQRRHDYDAEYASTQQTHVNSRW